LLGLYAGSSGLQSTHQQHRIPNLRHAHHQHLSGVVIVHVQVSPLTQGKPANGLGFDLGQFCPEVGLNGLCALAIAGPPSLPHETVTKEIYDAIHCARGLGRKLVIKPYNDVGWINYMIDHCSDGFDVVLVPPATP